MPAATTLRLTKLPISRRRPKGIGPRELSRGPHLSAAGDRHLWPGVLPGDKIARSAMLEVSPHQLKAALESRRARHLSPEK